MDLAILLRLVPAVTTATLVATVAVPTRRMAFGEAVDEVIRVLIVGLVAGRLTWLVLGGPPVWSSMVGTAILVRAGVETGAGVLAAAWWIGWRQRGSTDHSWRMSAAVPAGLAGLATWHGLCQVEGICGGVPVSWGVRLPGRAVPTFPASYVESLVLLVLLVLAWRWRSDGPRLWYLGAAAAFARVAIGFVRPALVGHPTRDQVLFAIVGIAALAVGRRWGRLPVAVPV